MRISATDDIEGSRILYPIGKIEAASAWHATGTEYPGNWRQKMLDELVRRAEDVDADAIIAVDYAIDSVDPHDESGVELQRILATGIAVKLSVAA
jgi:uncharacterized protein YbjQ (UPF0145 family)